MNMLDEMKGGFETARGGDPASENSPDTDFSTSSAIAGLFVVDTATIHHSDTPLERAYTVYVPE